MSKITPEMNLHVYSHEKCVFHVFEMASNAICHVFYIQLDLRKENDQNGHLMKFLVKTGIGNGFYTKKNIYKEVLHGL